MRKLVRNPVKLRIERPDYKKFRVADLGINIVENPKKPVRKPKEYTIMETSVQSNPTYSRSRLSYGAEREREKNVNVVVFTQNISNVPYVCFSDGHSEACFPQEWQMTVSILSRMIVKSGRKASEVDSEISKGTSLLSIPEGDLKMLMNDANKYGKIIEKERNLRKELKEVSSFTECDNRALRYLASILIH
jgi:hypothetical protein